MELKVFSIFDEKAEVYGQPFFMPHNGLALRAFSDLVGEVGTNVNKHPSDFKLYVLGSYDDVSGKIVSNAVPQFLANAMDFVKKSEN